MLHSEKISIISIIHFNNHFIIKDVFFYYDAKLKG